MTLKQAMPFVFIFLAFCWLTLVGIAVSINTNEDQRDNQARCNRAGFVYLLSERVCVPGFRP